MGEQLSPMSVLTAWIQNYNCIFLSIQHFNTTHLLLDKRNRKYEIFFFVSLVCLRQSFTYGKAFHVSC